MSCCVARIGTNDWNMNKKHYLLQIVNFASWSSGLGRACPPRHWAHGPPNCMKFVRDFAKIWKILLIGELMCNCALYKTPSPFLKTFCFLKLGGGLSLGMKFIIHSRECIDKYYPQGHFWSIMPSRQMSCNWRISWEKCKFIYFWIICTIIIIYASAAKSSPCKCIPSSVDVHFEIKSSSWNALLCSASCTHKQPSFISLSRERWNPLQIIASADSSTNTILSSTCYLLLPIEQQNCCQWNQFGLQCFQWLLHHICLGLHLWPFRIHKNSQQPNRR